jgi:hypothetical protein
MMISKYWHICHHMQDQVFWIMCDMNKVIKTSDEKVVMIRFVTTPINREKKLTQIILLEDYLNKQ